MVPVFPFLLAMPVLDSGKWLAGKKMKFQFALIGLLVIIFMPAANALIQRMFTEPEAEFMRFRMTPEWLTNDSLEEAKKKLELKHIRHLAIEAINQHIGESDCVYALQPSSIMLATRKVSFSLLGFNQVVDDFDPNSLSICKYVFMVAGMETHSAAAPALFPYEIMREHLKPVFTSELRNDGQDIVVAMLAEIVHEDKSQNDKQEESGDEFANFIDECLGRRFAAESQTPDGRIIQCPTGCFQPDAGTGRKMAACYWGTSRSDD